MLGAGVWSSRVKAREASGDLTSSGGRADTERQSLRREPCQVPASTHWPGQGGGGGGQVSGITGEGSATHRDRRVTPVTGAVRGTESPVDLVTAFHPRSWGSRKAQRAPEVFAHVKRVCMRCWGTEG